MILGRVFSVSGLPLETVLSEVRAAMADARMTTHVMRASAAAPPPAPVRMRLRAQPFRARTRSLAAPFMCKAHVELWQICDRAWVRTDYSRSTASRLSVWSAYVLACYWLWCGMSQILNGLATPDPTTLLGQAPEGARTVALGLLTLILGMYIPDGRFAHRRFLKALRARLASQGTRLDSGPGLALPRRLLEESLLVALFGVTLLAAIRTAIVSGIGSQAPVDSSRAGSVLLALLLIGFSLPLLAEFLTRAGASFGRRFEFALPALLVASSVALALGSVAFLFILSPVPVYLWNRLLVAQQVADAADPLFDYGNGMSLKQLQDRLDSARSGMWLIAALPAVGLLLASTLLFLGLRAAPALRLRSHEVLHSRDPVSCAVKSSATIGARLLLIPLWILIGTAELSLGTWVSLTALRHLKSLEWPSYIPTDGPETAPGAGPVVGTARGLEFLFRCSPDHAVVQGVTCIAWWTASMLFPGALALSVVDYFVARGVRQLRLRRLLRDPPNEALDNAFRPLLDRLPPRFPHVVVIPSDTAAAGALEFGIFKRVQFVVLTSGCVQLLEQQELTALLGHEASHLLLGHCWTHNLLHLAARLTLCGGTVAGIAENSYLRELHADRAALERLGVDRTSLQRCLEKMHIAAAFARPANASPGLTAGLPLGYPSVAARAQSAQHAARRLPLRAQLRDMIALYRSECEFVYWHPAVEDRIQALTKKLVVDDRRTDGTRRRARVLPFRPY